jgi:hypothetical protein
VGQRREERHEGEGERTLTHVRHALSRLLLDRLVVESVKEDVEALLGIVDDLRLLRL